MTSCSTCGNNYHNPITVTKGGETFTFDSLECAVHRLAPTCASCGVRVLGHGLEATDGAIFCCGHCADRAGVQARA